MKQKKNILKRCFAMILAAALALSLAGCSSGGRSQRDIQQNTNNGPKVYLPVGDGPAG